MKSLLLRVIALTKPFVWRLAEAYDLKIQRPVYGDQEVRILGGAYQRRHQIPKSVHFNTRSGTITVGANTVFGEDVKVLTGKHLNAEEAPNAGVPLHHVPRGRDVVIESHCYIGANAIIIGPCRIGSFSVIGAGAVVTKDIPPHSVAFGCPAHVVRQLQIPQDAVDKIVANSAQNTT